MVGLRVEQKANNAKDNSKWSDILGQIWVQNYGYISCLSVHCMLMLISLDNDISEVFNRPNVAEDVLQTVLCLNQYLVYCSDFGHFERLVFFCVRDNLGIFQCILLLLLLTLAADI